MMSYLRISTLLLLLMFHFNGIKAQSVVSTELPPATENSLYGWSTAIDGDWCIVASPQKDSPTLQSVGEVTFMQFSDNEWVIRQTEKPGGLPALSNFGTSVALDNGMAMISSIGDHSNGLFSGIVHLYELENGVWTHSGNLKGSQVRFGDRFGSAIDLSGDLAVIGSPMGQGNEMKSGTVYVFERSGALWTESFILSASDGKNGDFFGHTVEIIDANTIAVSAYRADGTRSETGAVYIFERSDDGWVETQKIVLPEGRSYDVFGYSLESIALADQFSEVPLLFVGTPGTRTENGVSGAVYVFKNPGEEWQLTREITHEELAGNSHFGVSLETDNLKRLFIGASRAHSENQRESGEVYAYTINKNADNFSFDSGLTLQLDADDEYTHFGATVSASPEFVVISSPYQDRDDLNNSGMVHVFTNLSVSNEEYEDEITSFELYQNYPNPFNPSTTIDYQIPNTTEVTLQVFDMLGRSVSTLVDSETKPAGRYQVSFNASNLASGMYIYQLRTSETVLTRKLTLIK